MYPSQIYIETLRTAGYRITQQREMIIEAITQSGEHINAEQVFAQVRKKSRSVNIATVYRTLDMLIGEGLANRIDLGEGRVAYATYQHGPHIHLVCRQCGQVADADQELLLTLNKRLSTSYHSVICNIFHLLCND
jgi:Fur family ferric uptake transcriptional regulator